MSSTIDLRVSRLCIADGVAELSHQRPQSRNVMSMELRADYKDMLDRIEPDPSVRVLILTGSGGCFCAGGDVKGMQSRLEADGAQAAVASVARARLRADHHGWLHRLHGLDMPVIAAVDGAAAGAGVSLALMADFVLASSRAVFCLSFARIGAVPDFASFHTLPRIVGLAKAKELMMTARRFGADEAKALGIVYEIHPAETLSAQAHALAARLARGPREALGMIKSSLNRSFDVDCQTMGEIEAHQQAVAMSMPFHAEAVARFARKEAPSYDWERDGRA